jgi:hypothetical protein
MKARGTVCSRGVGYAPQSIKQKIGRHSGTKHRDKLAAAAETKLDQYDQSWFFTGLTLDAGPMTAGLSALQKGSK